MQWFRRWTALFLCCALLGGGMAQAAGVDALSILSQMDERLLDESFQYRGMDFRFGGCGPSSVTNALIGTLNITDFQTAAALLYDVMHFMSSNPSQYDIDPDRLWSLHDQDILERFPALSSLLAEYHGNTQTLSRRFDANDIRRTLDAGTPALFVSRTTIEKNDWIWLRDTVDVLYTNGCHDARISIGFLSGGTSSTTGPFRSGASGHYITLCIPVDEFHETGTVYLFDSLPRSLDNEDYESDERFFAAYAFNGDTSRAREFKSQWNITRVSNTVLRLSPVGGKATSWQEMQYQLSLLEVYDTGIAFLACGPKTN